MKADFSIVIPCFNDGATIEEALDSVAGEGAAEIVIVDDGSTDPETMTVMRTLRERGLRVITQPNAGLSAARMAGVRACAAEYIVPLDADDRIEPGSLARLAAELRRNPDASVAFGDMRYFGTVQGAYRCAWGWDPWVICQANLVPGGGAMIRRDALMAVGGWVLEGGYEDWDLWMSLIEAGHHAVYVPGTVLHYRQRDGRMLSGSKLIHADLFDTARDRHRRLFADRDVNRRHTAAPKRLTLAVAVIDRVPRLSSGTRHRLILFVAQPHRALAVRTQRLGRRLRALTPLRARQ